MADQLTLTEESFGLTIIDGESLQLTLDGGNGPAGAAGATGAAGPNTVTTSTSTTLTGYIFGNGTTIAGATAAATAATANTLVLRDGSGNTSIGTATGSVTGNAGTVTSIGNLTGVVTSTNRATSINDAALSIAMTNGLQTALNGKQAVAITRDTTEGRPIYSETITIADYPTVGGAEVLSFSGLLNGRPYYTSTGYGVYWDGAGLWVIYDNNAASEAWSSAEPVDTPQEVTSWDPEPASSGTPAVTGSAQTNPTASSVGQLLRYGDSAPFEWYVAKGSGASTSWVLLVDNDSVNRAIEQGPAFSRFSLGITTIGDGLVTAATESDARTALGSGATGDSLFTAATPAAARGTLGVRTFTKPSDESRSSNTTYTVDSHLKNIPLEAGKSYKIELFLAAYLPLTEGGKARLVVPLAYGTVPNGAGFTTTGAWGNGNTGQIGQITSGSVRYFQLAASSGYNQSRTNSGVAYTGVLSASGVLSLEWAQNTSGANATIMLGGSIITVTEL